MRTITVADLEHEAKRLEKFREEFSKLWEQNDKEIESQAKRKKQTNLEEKH